MKYESADGSDLRVVKVVLNLTDVPDAEISWRIAWVSPENVYTYVGEGYDPSLSCPPIARQRDWERWMADKVASKYATCLPEVGPFVFQTKEAADSALDDLVSALVWNLEVLKHKEAIEKSATPGLDGKLERARAEMEERKEARARCLARVGLEEGILPVEAVAQAAFLDGWEQGWRACREAVAARFAEVQEDPDAADRAWERKQDEILQDAAELADGAIVEGEVCTLQDIADELGQWETRERAIKAELLGVSELLQDAMREKGKVS